MIPDPIGLAGDPFFMARLDAHSFVFLFLSLLKCTPIFGKPESYPSLSFFHLIEFRNGVLILISVYVTKGMLIYMYHISSTV